MGFSPIPANASPSGQSQEPYELSLLISLTSFPVEIPKADTCAHGPRSSAISSTHEPLRNVAIASRF